MSTRLPPLLTTADLARVLGVHRNTINNWRKLGIIPSPKQIGQRLYWQHTDILAFIQNRDAS